MLLAFPIITLIYCLLVRNLVPRSWQLVNRSRLLRFLKVTKLSPLTGAVVTGIGKIF